MGDGAGPRLLSASSGEAGVGEAGVGEAGLGEPGLPLVGAGRVGPALRWRLGLRVAVLIGILSVAAGAWFWWQVTAARPDVVPLSDVTSSAVPSAGGLPADSRGPAGEEDAAAASGPGSAGAGAIVVHVAGAVAKPGVVQVPSGSRVYEAVAAAGGSTPAADLNRLNLAAVVEDGQKIYVPQPGETMPSDASGASSGGAAGGGGASDGSTAAGGGKTNLNTAGVEELDALPKVGPVLAQRIVDWRKEHGPFKTVEELDAVDGVGPKMLETLLPLVRV